MTCNACNPQTQLLVTRGESKTFRVTVRDKCTRVAVDITGAKVWFTVKARIEDVSPVISKRNLAAGGTDAQALVLLPQTDAQKGQFEVYLDPMDTECLDPSKTYVCDMWVELTTGKRYQVVKKRAFKIEAAVTTVFTP